MISSTKVTRFLQKYLLLYIALPQNWMSHWRSCLTIVTRNLKVSLWQVHLVRPELPKSPSNKLTLWSSQLQMNVNVTWSSSKSTPLVRHNFLLKFNVCWEEFYKFMRVLMVWRQALKVLISILLIYEESLLQLLYIWVNLNGCSNNWL